jgi:nucleoside-diphosphate-sugar epimerase
MKIVVTGANGHLGRNLVRNLLSEGHRVCAFDLTTPEHVPPGLEFVRGDVRDREALTSCYEGADQVYHLAAVISIDGDRGGLVSDVST